MSKPNFFFHFLGEWLSIFFLYVLAWIVSLKVGRFMPGIAGQALVVICVMVPFLLMVRAMVRLLRRLDEYLRVQMLQNLAIAAGLTAGWTFTCGILENTGFPRLSLFTVWPAMGVIWGLVTTMRCVVGR